MRFEETQQSGEHSRVSRPRPKLPSPDSGQIDESPRPPRIAKRCGKRGERESHRVISVCARQGYNACEGKTLAKILIVEDNALNIKLFCDLLAAHGHEPEAVTDSRNALDKAKSFQPDLVITDIQLPHVSGLELIRMIRNNEQLAHVPIMAVT